MYPSRSRRLTRRRHGDGDKPILSASSTLLKRPLACSSATIRQSAGSRSGFGISAKSSCQKRHIIAFLSPISASFARTCPRIACHDDGISPRKSSEPVMRDPASYQSLLDAVERYFDLMFDGDVSRFGDVFAPSAQLHGLRDGSLRLLSAQEFKNALAAGPSPKSRNAPRQQELLLVDFASPTQALVKVRVRIDTLLYLDYLSYHCVNSAWLITAKSFHIEQRYDAPNN